MWVASARVSSSSVILNSSLTCADATKACSGATIKDDTPREAAKTDSEAAFEDEILAEAANATCLTVVEDGTPPSAAKPTCDLAI